MIFLGLLPLWAIIADMAMFPDQIGATHWLLLLAIPACVVTLPIAVGTSTIYSTTRGEKSRKLMSSAGFIALMLICIGIAVAWYVSAEKKMSVL